MTGSHSTQWTEVYLSHSISLSHDIPRHPGNVTQRNRPASLSRHHQMPFQRPGLIQQSSSFTLFIHTIMTSIETNHWTWADEQRRRKKMGLPFLLTSFVSTEPGSAWRLGPLVFLFYFLLSGMTHTPQERKGAFTRLAAVVVTGLDKTMGSELSQPAGFGRAISDSGKAFGLRERAIWAWHAWPGTAASHGTARPYVEIQRVNNGIWLLFLVPYRCLVCLFLLFPLYGFPCDRLLVGA